MCGSVRTCVVRHLGAESRRRTILVAAPISPSSSCSSHVWSSSFNEPLFLTSAMATADTTEDQEQELEALEAIYPNEITVICKEPGDLRFTILLTCDDVKTSDSDDEDDKNTFSVLIEFLLPENYPHEVPSILVLESNNLMPADEEELLQLLNHEAHESRGTVMIFTLVTIASEWLRRRTEEDAQRKLDAEDRRRQEIEEAENKKFEGTRVTVESFMKWKLQFDEEMTQLKKKKLAMEKSGKLTGRELFEKDQTLNESDLKFIEDDRDISYDDAGVKVDTALFDEDFEDDDDCE